MKLFSYIIIFGILIPAIQTINAQDSTSVEQNAIAPEEEPVQITEPAPAPKKQKTSKKDKIYYGGYVNLSFGDYTVIGVEPMIGYKITPKLSLGLKIRYDYISDKRYEPTRTYSNYGGSVFARYRVLQPLYFHIEYAGINYEYYDPVSEGSNREWVPFLFVGAGFSQSIGGRTWLNAQVLFDVLQSSNSPYNDWEPFFSVGIGVGF